MRSQANSPRCSSGPTQTSLPFSVWRVMRPISTTLPSAGSSPPKRFSAARWATLRVTNGARSMERFGKATAAALPGTGRMSPMSAAKRAAWKMGALVRNQAASASGTMTAPSAVRRPERLEVSQCHSSRPLRATSAPMAAAPARSSAAASAIQLPTKAAFSAGWTNQPTMAERTPKTMKNTGVGFMRRPPKGRPFYPSSVVIFPSGASLDFEPIVELHE